MFVLYTLNNIIVIKPSELVGDSHEILYKTLQAKYLFKILEDEGLCVEILSFTIKECVIVNGQGDYQYDVPFQIDICITNKVELKLVIFRATKDEILIGKVEKCVPDGVIVSLDFVEVFIPTTSLNEPNRYDKKERVWIWMYNDNLDFFYEKGEKIKFQVESVHFQKTSMEVDGQAFHIVGNCKKDGAWNGKLVELKGVEI